MFDKAKIIAGTSAIGAVLVGLSAFGALPAAASTKSVQSSPAKGLLTAAQASQLGFPKASGKVQTSNKTGVSGCSRGAEVAFENSTGATGLVAEVLVCSSTKGPAKIIKNVKATGSTTPKLTPPEALGSTASEKATDGTTYAIYWQRGKILELVAFDSNVPASSSSTTTTSVPAPPLTAAQQQTLSKAALDQDAKVG